MRQDRRVIEDLFFLLFKRLITVKTRERELLKYNNAFNNFRIIIINLPLGGGSVERVVTKEEQ